ncbi:MAG: hypothetical protein U1D35_09205, partial [Paracoccaceae bacterium]|nr:hypothetical protein [Paracoccaceae bacterium]
RARRRIQVPPFNGYAHEPLSVAVARVRKIADQRLQQGQQAARALPGLRGLRLALVLFYQRLAMAADTRAVLRALPDLRSAALDATQALGLLKGDPAQALHLARRAVRLAPQNWRYHLRHAEALLAVDQPAHAETALVALRQAMALAPEEPLPVEILCRLLADLDRGAEAMDAAERAVIMAPDVRRILENAAGHAQRSKRSRLALLYAHAALVAEPAAVTVHRRLARLHLAMRNPEMAGRRTTMADQLAKAESDRKSR